jgi:hypothetical protein
MKKIIALLIILISTNVSSQGLPFLNNLGKSIGEKIGEGILKITPNAKFKLDDDPDQDCSQTSNFESTGKVINSVAGGFGSLIGYNESFTRPLNNAKCQNWLKVKDWSFEQDNKISDEDKAKLKIFEDSLISTGVPKEMRAIMLNSHRPSILRNLMREKVGILSCGYLIQATTGSTNECETYIDLDSFQKGDKNIDFTFYQMWNFKESVKFQEVVFRDNAIFSTKEGANQVDAKSVRNVIGINCSKKSFIIGEFRVNSENMGMGQRISNGYWSRNFGRIYGFRPDKHRTVEFYDSEFRSELDNVTSKVIAAACDGGEISKIKEKLSLLQFQADKNTKINSSGDSSKTLNINTKSADDNLSLVTGSINPFKQLNKGEESDKVHLGKEAIVTDYKKADAIQNSLTSQQMFAELQKMNFELKSLSASVNVLTNPTTLAQKYHNARILSLRGEFDLSLKAYEDLMREKVIYADTIQEILALSKRIYGLEGSKKYIEKTMSHLKGRPEYLYAIQKIDEEPTPELWKEVKDNIDIFPPLGYAYLNKYYDYCLTLQSSKINACLGQAAKLEGAEQVAIKLTNKIKSGEILNYYIDSNKANIDIEDFNTQFSRAFFSAFPSPGSSNRR